MSPFHLSRSPATAMLLAAAILPAFTIADAIAYWTSPRALAVQDTIYIEGGDLWNGSFIEGQFVNAVRAIPEGGMLFKIDMCKNFSVSGNESVNENPTSLILEHIDYIPDPDYNFYQGGGMFTNDYEVYTFGGLSSGINDTESGMTYVSAFRNTAFEQKNWRSGEDFNWKGDDAGDKNVADASRRFTHGAWTSAPSESLSWWFGGLRAENFGPISSATSAGNPDVANISSNTLLQFDLSSEADVKMTNITVPSDLKGRAEGGLVWLPYGEQGVLLAFGGVTIPGDLSSGISQNASEDYSNPFMTNILVYDVKSGVWSTQTTIGEVTPGQRASFCTVVATAPNNDSHHIYVYGGYDGTYATTATEAAFDDVWVLSIPSFRWTQVSPGTEDHRRQNHVCAKLNPTQMLSIGGNLEYGQTLLNNTALDIFDLSSAEWVSEHVADLNAAYSIPSQITAGGFDITSVPADLVTTVKNLMNTRYTKPVQTYFGTCATNITGPVTSPKPTPTGIKGWEIAVIVVAVVVALAAGALIWFCCFRKRRGSESDDTRRNSILNWMHKSTPAAPKSTTDSDGTVVATPVAGYFENKQGHNTETYEMASNVPSPGYNSFGHASPQIVSYSSATSPFMGSVEVDAQSRHEIMDHVPREGQSVRQHYMYPRSFSGDQITSVRSDTISNGSEVAGPSRHYGHISPYELAHDRSHENLAPPPTDLALGEPQQKNGSSHSLGVGAEQVHSPAVMTPVAPISRRPVGSSGSPDGSEADRPGHTRNMSSMSSNLPNLPSPGPDEDRRRSRLIDVLPDMASGPSSPAQPQTAKKSVYTENLDV